MDDNKGSAMIALLPITTDWCRIELPHLTLVYAGEIEDLQPGQFNEMAKDASALAMLSNSIHLKTKGTDVFGGEGEEKVDVIKLQPSSELWAMRRAVENWDESEFPFNPHVTIGPIGSSMSLEMMPGYIAFDRIMVAWGDEYLTFWLKR